MRLLRTLRTLRMFSRLIGRMPIKHLLYLGRKMSGGKLKKFNGRLRLNTLYPPYPSPAFDRFCRIAIERKRVPTSTYIAVTGKCPYSCPHCSYEGRPKEELSNAQMLDIITQVKDLGTATIGFTGGEPLLRSDLDDLIAASGPEMASIIFTTGHGIDPARAGRLADAGVSCVLVGIEASRPEDHDEIRGEKGSWEEGRSAIRACHEAGLYTGISTVATRGRIASGELEAMYKLGAEWRVGQFRIIPAVATGALKGCAASMLTKEEMQWLIDFHAEHNRLSDGPSMECFAFLESEALFGCGAGFHHLFIDAVGNVCPCDLTPLSFGNAAEESLADIWQRMGEYFPLPRCGCLMGRIGERINGDYKTLPLTPEQSQQVCPKRVPDEPVPKGYQYLLHKRKGDHL